MLHAIRQRFVGSFRIELHSCILNLRKIYAPRLCLVLAVAQHLHLTQHTKTCTHPIADDNDPNTVKAKPHCSHPSTKNLDTSSSQAPSLDSSTNTFSQHGHGQRHSAPCKFSGPPPPHAKWSMACPSPLCNRSHGSNYETFQKQPSSQQCAFAKNSSPDCASTSLISIIGY